MATIAKKPEGSGDFKLVPEGVHMAVCDMMVDIGMQPVAYQGETKMKHKIYLRFQIPAQRVTINGEDLPMVIGNRYTLSLFQQAILRKHLVSWRGQEFTPEEENGFDVETVVGVPCQIQIIHNKQEGSDRTYANIGNIMALPQGMEGPKPENGTVIYHKDDGETTVAMALPGFIRKWCGLVELTKESTQEQPSGLSGEHPAGPMPDFVPDQRIPF